jgi:peptide chain release factor 2
MERDHLSKQLDAIEKIEYQLNDSIELIAMAEDVGDDETVEEIAKEIQNLAKEASQSEIECMLSDEMDGSSCFLEIHSGAGGTESDDWASMLLRMYLRWAEKHRYKISIVDQLDGEEAGVKSATVKIEGMNAFGWLKVESGIHRLVRISPFNSAGKRHTSFASVNVMPVINDDVEINIVESDLRIDTYRSSGAGGQHVNTTDSAVRITHIPTGIVAQCQNNRSQHKNRDECMSMLKSKLYELEMQKRRDKANEENEKKSDIGWGHQIRSYVLHPYKMVKDLRTGFKVTDTGAVLDGDIDDFIRSMLELKLSGKGFTLITEDD